MRTEWLDAGFAVTALDFPQAWSCNGEYVWIFLFSLVSVQGNLRDGWMDGVRSEVLGGFGGISFSQFSSRLFFLHVA